MKNLFFFITISICSMFFLSCGGSQERQQLVGTWESTFNTTDSEDNLDYKCKIIEKDTYKDNGDSYESGTATFTYTAVDVDYTTVVEYTYEYTITGTWSISGDQVTLNREKSNFDLQGTKFHLYDTESGQEMVPDTEYKNQVLKSIKTSLNENFDTEMKELKEPGIMTIISISNTEMQMEDKDGVTTYKKVN